jgi:hypothetical protein
MYNNIIKGFDQAGIATDKLVLGQNHHRLHGVSMRESLYTSQFLISVHHLFLFLFQTPSSAYRLPQPVTPSLAEWTTLT